MRGCSAHGENAARAVDEEPGVKRTCQRDVARVGLLRKSIRGHGSRARSRGPNRRRSWRSRARGEGACSTRKRKKVALVPTARDGRGPALLEHLRSQGVLATGLIGLRFVTHLDVDRAGIERAVTAVRGFFEEH